MVDLLILAEAAHAGAAHATPTAWGLSPGGWVAMSMVAVFAVMLWLKVPALVGSMLDSKIDGIRNQLAEAAKLRAEAEALKAEYAAKLADAEQHGTAMKAAAEEEAKHIVAKAKTDAAALIVRRQKMAEEKIAAAERSAVDALRARAASTAAAAAGGLIAETHDAKADKALVDEAIAAI